MNIWTGMADSVLIFAQNAVTINRKLFNRKLMSTVHLDNKFGNPSTKRGG